MATSNLHPQIPPAGKLAFACRGVGVGPILEYVSCVLEQAGRDGFFWQIMHWYGNFGVPCNAVYASRIRPDELGIFGQSLIPAIL